MANYKTALALSVAEAAYIAGLIDGEGTVTLTRKHRGENRQLAVTVSSTERPLLDFVLKSVGVGKITNKAVSKPHHTPSHTYAVYNQQALQVLRQVAPYLRSYKSRRCALALSEYTHLTPRNGKYSVATRRARDLFEKTFLEIRPGNGSTRAS